MKRTDLIEKLQSMTIENVFIFDFQKNLEDDSGDGSSEGIYELEIDEITESEKPWIALTFNSKPE